MISAIKRRFDRLLFNIVCHGVYASPPVRCALDSDVVIVSQLHHPDMTMYLLAVKSFARYVKPKYVVIVDDGLTDRDRQVLSSHLGSVKFVDSASVQCAPCPEGGCWERIITLSNENQDNYVIQLDSDTLTLEKPQEVMDCIAQQRTFTMGTSSGQHIVGFVEASAHASKSNSDHIQNHAERALAHHPDRDRLNYVRGCAGFAGFAKGELPLAAIRDFSSQMEKLVGVKKWREWGSEQVTSNYMAANSAKVLVLPINRYPFWFPESRGLSPALIHFFGSYRFYRYMYPRLGLSILKQLQAGLR